MIDSRHFDTTTVSHSSSPLRVTSTELTHLLDISPDALLIVDREGTIVMANEQAAALFGYRREEVRQQRLEMLLPERLHPLHVAHREHSFPTPRTRAMGAELQLIRPAPENEEADRTPDRRDDREEDGEQSGIPTDRKASCRERL